jgi:hypothetical protein
MFPLLTEAITWLKGLIVVLKGQTTLPWWSYIVALLVGGKSPRAQAKLITHEVFLALLGLVTVCMLDRAKPSKYSYCRS